MAGLTYELWQEGVTLKIRARSLDAARRRAREWALEGDYNDPASTLWVEVAIKRAGDVVAEVTVAIDPDEPACSERGEDPARLWDHDWQAPVEIVGGCESNPGVWDSGGGVKIAECCMRCGCRKLTDTWATNPVNGKQGLTSVSYDDGFYETELAEYRAAREAVS